MKPSDIRDHISQQCGFNSLHIRDRNPNESTETGNDHNRKFYAERERIRKSLQQCPNCGFDQDDENPTHCLSCGWPLPRTPIQKPYALQVCNAGAMPDHLPTSFEDWLKQGNDAIDDPGGNIIPSRVLANHDQYGKLPF